MKTIIITGGGTGIGRATAIAFRGAGWNVAVAGRRLEPLREVAVACGALAIPADVADEASVTALFAQTVAAFGRLDVLFNNAAINIDAIPFEDQSVSDLRALIDINVTGALLCARQAVRVMKAQTPQGGRIINTGSLSAHSPRPHSAAYVMSKHAMTGLTKSLLLDGRPYGISAAQIDIGNAVSDMSEQMVTGALQADGSRKAEPRMEVDHVAQTVLSMAMLPPEVNTPFVTLMATHMPFYGRG
jgi:NAD(P)-dependent dehydrogenase (short-subunit alcohol dehydrogenase family)